MSEAEALIRHLQAWLAEQPEQRLKPAKANFKYGSDGNLRTVNLTLFEDGE
ncbi:hypothetical protein PG5_40410 [Pseudomonas sp. G5(2012)]|nr:hypothetical protein PG5_40410 [Pseudomonas sp. G5(2012)]